MLLESFSNTILRYLRIPPGTSLRHPNEQGPGTGSSDQGNEYLDTIVEITVDDICIGEEPLSISYDVKTPSNIASRLNDICDEFNTIVKDVATDLCKVGISCYHAHISKSNKLVLLPWLDPVKVYLNEDKEVIVVDEDNIVDDVVVFLNYNRSSLTPVEDKSSSYKFEVIPTPMQLKNVQKTISSLNNSENSLDRYRNQISRIARWINVDVGLSQGADQKDVVDTISSAINADSSSLSYTNDDFNDNIPVLPHRKGIGKAELVADIPNYDIKSLADIDYNLGKLNLLCRFPGSYMDFTKNLDATAVSLIRGDLRYSKLCNKVRSKIVKVINDFLSNSKKFGKYKPVVTLTQLPTSEDEDVNAALGNYVELCSSVEEFVNPENTPKVLKLHRLKLLQDLFASSTTSPTLQKWFDDFRSYIEKSDAADDTPIESELESPGLSGLEESPDVEIEPDLDNVPDVEFIEEQTE